MKQDKTQFIVAAGTVQCYIARSDPFFMQHYGRAEYDRDKPVMSDRMREQGNAVCILLNNQLIDIEQAKKILDKI